MNIFHFKKKVFVDKQREKRVKHIIITIAVLTMLPSALLTYMLVREDMFANKANNFIADVVSSDHTQVISKDVDYRKREIRLVTIGDEIPDQELSRMQSRLADFGLEGTKLSVVQGTKNLTAGQLKTMLDGTNARQADKNAQLLANEKLRADQLAQELAAYRQTEQTAEAVGREMAALFPEAARVSISRTVSFAVADSLKADSVTLVCLSLKRKADEATRQKMLKWLEARLQTQDLELVTEMQKTKQ